MKFSSMLWCFGVAAAPPARLVAATTPKHQSMLLNFIDASLRTPSIGPAFVVQGPASDAGTHLESSGGKSVPRRAPHHPG